MNKESNNKKIGCFWAVILFIVYLFTTPVIPLLLLEFPILIEYKSRERESEQKIKEYLEKQPSLVLPGITTDGLVADLEKNWDFRFDLINYNTTSINDRNLDGFFIHSIINNNLLLSSNVVILQNSRNDILSIKYSVEMLPPLLPTDAFSESGVPYHFLTNAPLPARTPADRAILLQWIKSEISTLSAETNSTIKMDDIEYSIKVKPYTQRTYVELTIQKNKNSSV